MLSPLHTHAVTTDDNAIHYKAVFFQWALRTTCFPGNKAAKGRSWPFTPQLVLSWRMRGAIPPLLHIPSWCTQGQRYVYNIVHSTHAHREFQNLLRRVVNKQVTGGKNSAHVANSSSLDWRSLAHHKATGGLRATDCLIFGSSYRSSYFRDPLIYEFNKSIAVVIN
jgi:hypothetical protein